MTYCCWPSEPLTTPPGSNLTLKVYLGLKDVFVAFTWLADCLYWLPTIWKLLSWLEPN